MKKKIFINIFLLMIIFIICEIISYSKLISFYKNDIINFNKVAYSKKIKIPYIKYSKVILPQKELLINNLRPVEYRNKKTYTLSSPPPRPIILFGCSFTEGFGLKRDQTFAYKLADYTDRDVYNRGRSGTGLPFLYYQLSDKEIIKELPHNAEYIIYTLIPDHFPRLFKYRSFAISGDYLLKYKIVNDKLVEDKIKFPFLHTFFTSVVIEEYITKKKCQDINNMSKLSLKLFRESYKKIKENFPESKFVIIYYIGINEDKDIFKEQIEQIQNIDKENIIIIRLENELPELRENEKYWLEDKLHPSEEAWNKIVPLVAKKLKL